MPAGIVRGATFLAGLLGLISLEASAPHHPATAPRARRWLTNLSWALVNGGIVTVLCAACYGMAARQILPWRLGPFERLTLAPWVRIGLEILTLDLLAYFLHRAYHRFPFLWNFHKVHHTDLDLDVTSASRFHTGEVLVSGIVKLLTVAVLGISPTGLVSFEVVMVLAAQFQHSNVRIPEGITRVLWYSLVPPSMHRIHHMPDRDNTDSNYGTIVTSWDWLFGTLRRRHFKKFEFGLEQFREERKLGFWALARMPFARRVGRDGLPSTEGPSLEH